MNPLLPRVRPRAALGLLAASAMTAAILAPADIAAATTSATSSSGASAGTLADPVHGLPDIDLPGRLAPLASQRSALSALGTTTTRWNAWGTPASILPADGVLAGGVKGKAVASARAFLTSHAAVFGLSPAQMAGLELVNEQKLAQSPARAVLFRQRFGDLAPAQGGLVTVGVAANGSVSYVSSSLSRTVQAPPAARLTLVEGFAKAAANVGRSVSDTQLARIKSKATDGITRLTVPGFTQPQLVRLRALALPGRSVRPVVEVNLVDVRGGVATAYGLLVDAVDGTIWTRRNLVENSSDVVPFTGTATASGCGPVHKFSLTDDKTRTITALVTAAPVDDVVAKIVSPTGQLLASGDLGTSPEVVTYTAPVIPRGEYGLQVCPYEDGSVIAGPYTAVVSTSDQAAPSAGDLGTLTGNPTWRAFSANPSMDSIVKGKRPSNSSVFCWSPTAGCSTAVRNVAAPAPWDALTSGLPTFTTVGNNASTHEAWLNPLAPGGLLQAPLSPTRAYTTAFTDAWNESGCSPTEFVPGGNDIDASVTNLFVSHNRMHDWSYYLGFTEDNYNMQAENLGRGGRGGDPEVGNAQAGAVDSQVVEQTGVATGRNNANQIALMDGVSGITNQYLFQPVAGAFYAPCTDGALDMGIVGHEYTHAISNRMVGGPDDGLTSEQGGAMGESWSDLAAGEYMYGNGYSNGGNPWAIGVYATGNKQVAIRDYAINANPLNYSDYGFDSTGPEVHADGEIWNGTQWEVRQALVAKWNAKYPYTDKKLQLACAAGTPTRSPLAPEYCPGNRRWIQLIFDAWLLQQGATSMLDARDAMLAADQMRFGGQDLSAMWGAFARRGMGRLATTPSADSDEPTPDFSSPRQSEVRVSFRAPAGGKVYVGHYEARATPVADTLSTTKLDAQVDLVPGTYTFYYTSPRYGSKRVTRTLSGTAPVTVAFDGLANLAAKAAGAKVLAATAGSRNPDQLIDGTEATNWGGVTEKPVDESRPSVTIDLAGSVRTIRSVQVSAMLHPAAASSSTVPLAVDEDPDSGSRFTALRRFAIEVCTTSCASSSAAWRRIYTSSPDAFPGARPRPVAPNLRMRSFDVPDTRAAAVRLVALENQCTGYAGYAGEQDDDPTSATDCKTGSDRGTIVHAAELQVFGS